MGVAQAQAYYDPVVGEVDHYISPLDAKNAIAQIYTDMALYKTKDFVVNVLDFGADKTGVADSRTAIQNAINSLTKGTVYFPAGTYKTTGSVTLKSGVSLSGANNWASQISHTGSGDLLTGTDLHDISISDLGFTGPSTGTGVAIKQVLSASNTAYMINLSRIYISGFVTGGVYLDGLTGSTLDDVFISNPNTGSYGIQITNSKSGQYATAYTVRNCRVGDGLTNSYVISKTRQANFSGCTASTSDASGFSVTDSQGISFTGCGSSTAVNGWLVTTSNGVGLHGCYVDGSSGSAIKSVNSYLSVIALHEVAGAGTYSIEHTGTGATETGSLSVTKPTSGVTSSSFSGGTITNNLTIDTTGETNLRLDRPSTAYDSSLEFFTNGTENWSINNLTSSSNLTIWNQAQNKNALVLDNACTYMDVVNKKIINLSTPTAAADAATKGYVDTNYLPLTGGALSGVLSLSGAPTQALHAATKAYVDTKIPSNTILSSNDPAARPTADASIHVFFFTTAQPTAWLSGDVWVNTTAGTTVIN
jgi:hypothetical protein